MTNKLRAFVSSTMEDLGNERRAVVKTLKQMGIVPVNAEALSANGGTSWEVIYPELANAHIVILLLGDRYGWVPDSGYGAGLGLSITHLELRAARELRKPVLAFVKKLPYGAHVDADRDKLRREVSDWATGLFREEFEWADDLAEKVWRAFTSFWQDSVLRSLVPSTTGRSVEPKPDTAPRLQSESINGSRRVLLAGAGMSVAAGYPTAPFLMRLMANDLWGAQAQSTELQAFNFSTLAGFYATKLGESALRHCIGKALDTPQTVSPTPGHLSAVKCFRTIVTTNYDELFEQACRLQGIEFRTIHPLKNISRPPGQDAVEIFKLVGSVSDPTSMIITDDELALVAESDVHKRLSTLFAESELFVVGHGLRDGSVAQLLKNRPQGMPGTYVSPFASAMDEVLFHRFGLELVRQTADEFMTKLEAQDLESAP